jgi:hypothetical protein
MSTTHYLAYVPGPVVSYLRAPSGPADYDSDPARGLEFTESLADAARFASQDAVTSFLAPYTYTLPVEGGTGTPALTVLDP